jgi:hypothetical protein
MVVKVSFGMDHLNSYRDQYLTNHQVAPACLSGSTINKESPSVSSSKTLGANMSGIKKIGGRKADFDAILENQSHISC